MESPCPAALVSVLICAFALTARAAHPVNEPSVRFSLSGQNERDTGGTVVGDPDAAAVATLTVDHGTLRWSLTYENLNGDSITGLHLHGVGMPEAADPLLNLLPGFPAPTLPLSGPNGTLGGVVTSQDDPGLLTRMAGVFYGNEENVYLHVHTAGAGGFPAGAIRGVLPEPGAVALLAVGGMAFLRRRARR